MDDTQQSRVSDAAATRKRRSSILKSQRPARTPFSELEFNVATPTDTAKSRRVSFSRRTGVAEFVTNEATTTWKNFYEEHNKSLESSGNDSEVNASRQPVEHLGKRIFDQQFEEVEAVDFMGSLNPSMGPSTSLNNFTDQIASLECTSDGKINPPRNNFDLSALTDHQSKLFGNDFTVTGAGAMSGRIEVNFSNLQHIGDNDDLDDIERDLERVSNADAVCLGPGYRHNMSEYIEVDLNMTNVVKNYDCDMSITDTINSPKVQDVSKNLSIDKKVDGDNDWVADKENIAINPYVAPREEDNFAVNDEPNQVLVYDGKRLTLQTEKPDKEYRNTLLPNNSAETPQRKTIVLNINDDLPNFVSDVSSKSEIERRPRNTYNDYDLSIMSQVNTVETVPKRQTIHDNTGNISITQALPSKIISGGAQKRRTMVYGEEEANISITQALPSKIISCPIERRHTLVYNKEEGNISMTQALPSNIISDNSEKSRTIVDNSINISMTQALPSNIISGVTEKRKTIVYNEEEANISLTQALPSKIISDILDLSPSIHDIDEDINISMTQALPSNVINGATDRRRTLVYDQEEGNISMTQALPSNIISAAAENQNTILYDDEMEGNISITQILPSKIINDAEEKHKTVVCDQDEDNISVTQVLPSNIIKAVAEKRLTLVFNDDDNEANISMTQLLPSIIISDAVKRQTIVFEADGENISMTQCLPAKVINAVAEKRQTMTFDDDEANISVTQTLPAKVISGMAEKRQTMVFEDDGENVSMIQSLPAKLISGMTEKRQTMVFDDDEANISVTQSLPAKLISGMTEKRQTMVFDDDEANISVTQTLPAKVISGMAEKRQTMVFEDDGENGSMIQSLPAKLISGMTEKRQTVVFDDDEANISVTQTLPSKVISGMAEKRQTMVFEDDGENGSITQSLPAKLISGVTEKRQTVVFDSDEGNISVTQTLPAKVISGVAEKRQTIVFDDNEANISITQTLPAKVISSVEGKRETIVFDDGEANISDAQILPAEVMSGVTEKRQTMVFNSDEGNISVTQTLPAKVISGVAEKRQTIVFDDNKTNISITQTLPAKFIKNVEEIPQTKVFGHDEANISVAQAVTRKTVTSEKPAEHRKTVLNENDSGNISVAQVLPTSILQKDNQNEKRKTVIFDDSNANISISKSMSVDSNLEQVSRKPEPIVFNDDNKNIYIKQTLPVYAVLETNRDEQCRTVTYDDTIDNKSIIQTAPTNLNVSQKAEINEKRRTVVFQDDTGNISVTQALPPSITIGQTESKEKPTEQLCANNTLKDNDIDKRRTIVFEDETDDISATEAVPAQLLPNTDSKSKIAITNDNVSYEPSVSSSNTAGTEHKTTVNDHDTDDIAMSEPVYANIITPTQDLSREETNVSKQDNGNEQLIKKVPAVEFLLSGVESHCYITVQNFCKPEGVKRDDIFSEMLETENENIDLEMSVVETEHRDQDTNTKESSQQQNKSAMDTISLSTSRPIPSGLVTVENDVIHKFINKQVDLNADVSNKDVLLYQSAITDVEPNVNRTEQGDMNSEEPQTDNNSNVSFNKSDAVHFVETSSNEICSDDLSIQYKDAFHVAESKSEANLVDEPMDIDKLDIKATSIASVVKISPKSSVLEKLLDLSERNVDFQIDKDTVVSAESLPRDGVKSDQNSNGTFFYIVKEEDALIQTDSLKSNVTNEIVLLKQSNISMLTNTAAAEKSTSIIENTLRELNAEKKRSSSPENCVVDSLAEKCEVNISVEKHDVVTEPELDVVEKDTNRSYRKSFKNANDTKELLDMISDFTDKTRYDIGDDDISETNTKENVVKENKKEPLRLSFAPNRQSIVFTREDLLNNISMAQAALQKSRIEIEDSIDDTQDSYIEESTNTPPKTDRLSSEVVKTLHFDDESMSGNSTKSDISKQSPLRKTAFGETSYMKENKAKVIPTYLKDVTDGIKDLMTDLVKPMTDVLPFNSTTDRPVKKVVSTVSTDIQANLITSSQIDINDGLSSEPQSTFAIQNVSSYCIKNNLPREHSDTVKSDTSDSEVYMGTCQHQRICAPEVPGQVLIFDHANPLNNVLLGPLNSSNVHTYNPDSDLINKQKSNETLCGSDKSVSCQANSDLVEKDSEMLPEKITTMYNMTSVIPSNLPESTEEITESQNDTSALIAEKESIAINTNELKNAEVNTIIAMKENKELLNASSSLTLVDDPITETSGEVASKTSSKFSINNANTSPLRVIYKVEEQDGIAVMEKVEPVSPPKDEETKQTKGNKRNYKPSSLMTAVLPNVDITPKPKSKMQKLSNSPEVRFAVEHRRIITAERDIEIHERPKLEKVDLNSRKSSPRKGKELTNTTVTMQQVITEYQIETELNTTLPSKKLLDAIKSDCSSQSNVVEYSCLDNVSSFTSSKNLHIVKRGESVSTNISELKSQSTVPSVQSSKSGWQPDSSLSSSHNDFDAGVNIVAKIDMLSFMGSHECEWESSTADTWTFRLLHGRIRLTVRLAHHHANAIKTRVRADTPVNDITVETVQYEKKNPVSTLCVRFACETMRYMVSRSRGVGPGSGAMLARGVPALLRRCAAAARVALRWGRAMHDARMQLAYTLDTDGRLSLKVANIPLRSVWEVTMHIELVVSEATSAPWPRAGDVRVSRVVSDVRIPDEDIKRALASTPCDWGHAPRTVWRIFRYLKNKTREDELMLGAC